MYQGWLVISLAEIHKVLSEIHDKRIFWLEKNLSDVQKKILVAKNEIECLVVLLRVCGMSKGQG